jgi:NAD(P)-dependent dehydrogenase (short-subunit alcohol dehydrogenase family)
VELAGKTALVTGGAKRIGRALACDLAGEGVNVVVHCRSSTEEASQLAAELQTKGVQAWTVEANLEDPEQAIALIAQTVELSGHVDILINNASTFPPSRLADFTPADLHTNINVNALAPALIAREFATQDREGAIINLLDCRIDDYDNEHVAYHLSKRMLFSLTRMMAVEYAPEIRVNAVAPGLILPPAGKDERYLASLASTNPLNRYGSPDDVTRAVLFLLRSPFVTGQVIYLDGGRHMVGNMYG